MAETIQIRLEPGDCGPICIKDKNTEETIATMNIGGRDGAGNLCLEVVIDDPTRVSIERKDGKALPKPYKRMW